jgi:hypothetical protein
MSGWRVFDAAKLPEEVAAALRRGKPLTGLPEHTPAFVSLFVAATIKHLNMRIAARFDELEARIKELEDRPSLKWVGTWDGERKEPYEVQNVVTRSGSMWICKTPTLACPGTSTDWQLCVKRGDQPKEPRQ